jgi:hypothetical protein
VWDTRALLAGTALDLFGALVYEGTLAVGIDARDPDWTSFDASTHENGREHDVPPPAARVVQSWTSSCSDPE